MRYLMVLCLLFCVGCVLFSQAAYVDEDGEKHEAQVGVIDQIASGLGAASPIAPFAGLLSLVVGVVGSVGSYVTARRRGADAEEVVRFLNKMKVDIGKLASAPEVDAYIKEHLPKNKPYGKYLKAAYERLKKLGAVA